ncbi:hypothetical protein GmHk_18G050973 [Glycine max]|nr:hypothetical protein GmHk_18G050973 [Glycine max]
MKEHVNLFHVERALPRQPVPRYLMQEKNRAPIQLDQFYKYVSKTSNFLCLALSSSSSSYGKGMYVIPFTLLLASVQIKYTEAVTNPFLSTPAMPLLIASITCHGLASMADTNLRAPFIIFHLSGIVGCEVLIWVILTDIFWYCMVNMLASLVAFLCFFNNHIPNIFADHEMPIIEMQPPKEEV